MSCTNYLILIIDWFGHYVDSNNRLTNVHTVEKGVLFGV